MDQPTLASLGVPSATVERIEAVVRDGEGVVAIAATSTDLVTALDAFCSLDPLVERGVAVISSSGSVGPERAIRLAVTNRADASSAQAFRDAMAVLDVGAVVVSELFDSELADALFDDWSAGPLVVMGVHTWSATHVPTRIIDAGPSVEEVSSRLKGALAVRMAPRLCSECRADRAPTPTEREVIERVRPAPSTVSDPVGCSACGHRGTMGQVALSEWMEVTPPLRDLVYRDSLLRAAAFPEGVGTAPFDGLGLVGEGILWIEDWMRLSESFR